MVRKAGIYRKTEETEIQISLNYVYFVHSYYLKPKNGGEVVFRANYGVDVPAVIRKDNIIGMQFHPEKSGKTGEKFLKNIKELIK